jgi:hypothetical protein
MSRFRINFALGEKPASAGHSQNAGFGYRIQPGLSSLILNFFENAHTNSALINNIIPYLFAHNQLIPVF